MSKRMTAQDARNRAEKVRESYSMTGIAPLLKVAREAIGTAVKKGHFKIPDPLPRLRTIVTPEQRSGVHAALVADGFTVGQDGSIGW